MWPRPGLLQKNTPLNQRPIIIVPRDDAAHKFPCINLLEVFTKAQDYLNPSNNLPLSTFFSRSRECYVLSCDDEQERVDIRIHIFRSEENCQSIL